MPPPRPLYLLPFPLPTSLQPHHHPLFRHSLRRSLPRKISTSPPPAKSTTRTSPKRGPERPHRVNSTTTTTLNSASLPQAPPPSSPPPPSTPQPHRTPRLQTTSHALGTAFTLLLALDFLFTNIGQLMTVTGPSMSPLLNTDTDTDTPNDTVYVNISYPPTSLRRGDIIAFHSPRAPETLAVKRVIALPGDVVTTRGPYSCREEEEEEEEEKEVVMLPQGHVWVEGEHPEGSRWSLDSNAYGPVSLGLVVGRVEGVVWPWRRRGWVGREVWGGVGGRVREGGGGPGVEFWGA